MNIDIIEPSNCVRLSSNVKVSAIYHRSNKLYIGFTNGDLNICSTKQFKEDGSINPKTSKTVKNLKSFNDIKGLFNDNDQSNGVNLEVIFKNATKDYSPIIRLSCIPISNDNNRTVLVVANAELIRLYERVGTHLNLIKELEDSKYFSDIQYVHVEDRRLFVIGVKKKIIIYHIINKSRNIIQFSKLQEILLKDKIKTIGTLPQTIGNSLIVGLASDFILIDLDNDFTVKPLPVDETSLYNFNHSTSFSYFGLSSSGPTTWIISLPLEKLLLIKDTQAVVLTINGQSATISPSPVKFSVIPLFIAFINPSYLLIVYNKKIEIIDFDSGDLIQKFYHQINSSSIYVCHERNIIFLASGSDILQFNVLGYQKQIDQYLSISGKGSSTKSVKDPYNDLKIIGLEKAISLVSKLNDDDDFFENDKVSRKKQKQLVLRNLYQSKAVILFVSYSKYHEALVEIGSEWLLSYKDILALFPDFLNAEYQISNDYSSDSESVKSFSHNIVKRISLDDIQNTKLNSLTTADSGTEIEIIEYPSIKSSRPSSSPQKSSASTTNRLYSKSQGIRKFTKAVNNLIIYLTDQRRIHTIFLNDSNPSLLWKGIDITPFDIYPFITSDNLKSQLSQIATIIDTSLFLCYFHTKPMLLGPLLRLPNNKCSAKVVNECLLSNLHSHNQQPNFIKDLLDFYYGRNLHKDALEMLYELSHDDINDHEDEFDDFLKGPELTIQYLQKLSNDHLDLIFQYSHWIISEDKENIIKNSELIFMNDSYECEGYDNFKVLDYFINAIKHDSLAIRYLEWLLFESDLIENFDRKTISKLHTRLCLLYLKMLKELDVDDENFLTSDYYIKLYRFLGTTDYYEPWTVLKNIPTTEDKFLRFSIFIYKRLGEHDKAIDVLFNQLDDLDAAMKYCSDIYYQVNNKEIGEGLFHKLLEDLLIHSNENIESIKKLLTLQGSKMSILRIMTSLPNSFPLVKLSDFLTEYLRNSTETLHNSRIANQLYKVGNIKLQDKLLVTQSEGYLIESGKQLCSICNKKLGYSIFSVDKNNQIVHYGCFQRSR